MSWFSCKIVFYSRYLRLSCVVLEKAVDLGAGFGHNASPRFGTDLTDQPDADLKKEHFGVDGGDASA